MKSDRGVCHILADAAALALTKGAVAFFGVLQVIVVAQHGFLVYESIKAAKKFANYGCAVCRPPKEVDDALAAEMVKFYKEKAAKESPIYVETLNSNP